MQGFLDRGWRVIAATRPDDYARKLAGLGIEIEPVDFKRGGLDPVADLAAIFQLARLFRKWRPQLVHQFQFKPVFFGSLAARWVARPRIVNTFTGLGQVPARQTVMKAYLRLFARVVRRQRQITVFQNQEDRDTIVGYGGLNPDSTRLIISSGVDLDRFRPVESGPGNAVPQVLMAARLIWSKGIREYVEAARILHETARPVSMNLAGEWDSNHPQAVPEAWIREMEKSGHIVFWGHVGDMPERLQKTDIFVLPTFYGEGVPRVLLEAAATGLPVVATDMAGCREAVVNGETGILVPPQDGRALGEAIGHLLQDSALRQRMGQAGRRLMEERFEIKMIAEQYQAVYRELGIRF